MAKGVPIVAGAVAVLGFLGAAALMAVMMASMWGGGQMGMMGGRGSDPLEESPVIGATQVRVEDFAFAPASIVVDVGATVTWTNYDGVAHTVTSDEGDALDSPLLGEGETFTKTFDAPGEYFYYCKPHPNMQGLVTVRASGA